MFFAMFFLRSLLQGKVCISRILIERMNPIKDGTQWKEVVAKSMEARVNLTGQDC